MAGLAALQSYQSDSSSENEVEDDRPIQASRKTPGKGAIHTSTSAQSTNAELPLPDEILSMFNKSDSSLQWENPSDHQGRIRSFAHVPGNWATFVYIPANTSSICSLVEALITRLPQDLTFNPSDDLHLSLSRTVCLQFHWIEPFTQSLEERIDGVRSFQCHIEKVNVYTNDEKTRTFVGLKIGAGHESLCDLVTVTDDCLNEFSLPVFYKDPSFHISICWCVGDVTSRLNTTVLESLQAELYRHVGDLTVSVQDVHCKSGCKKFIFPLR